MIGGGVIGVEYATIFSALDIPITLIEARDTILDFVDKEIIAELMHELRERGVAMRLGCNIQEVQKIKNGRCKIILDNGREVRTDMILFAAGRYGATSALNLDVLGLSPDKRGRLNVDKNTFQTDNPNIYAVGDVISFLVLPLPQWSRDV